MDDDKPFRKRERAAFNAWPRHLARTPIFEERRRVDEMIAHLESERRKYLEVRERVPAALVVHSVSLPLFAAYALVDQTRSRRGYLGLIKALIKALNIEYDSANEHEHKAMCSLVLLSERVLLDATYLDVYSLLSPGDRPYQTLRYLVERLGEVNGQEWEYLGWLEIIE